MTAPAAAPRNRWIVLVAAILLQVGLGTMYAWSFFQSVLIKDYGWSHSQASLAFSSLICLFGLSCAVAGFNVRRIGPRRLAIIGGSLYSISFLVGALALHRANIPLFIAGFAVLGGVGAGLAYVTPVSTVARWFPDKKGLPPALVVMGFGLGAFMLGKFVAPPLMVVTGGRLDEVFLWVGLMLSALLLPAALLLHESPPGYRVGPAPVAQEPAPTVAPAVPRVLEQPKAYLLSTQYVAIWLLFFFSATAGIAVISFQSGLIQEIWIRVSPTLSPAVLASYGATMIAVSSLFNAGGRLAWVVLSRWTGHIGACRLMVATQMIAFGLMLSVETPWLFGALVCYVLSCYGGILGVLPAMLSGLYGQDRLPVVYGTILTALAAAGIAGPLLVAALQDANPDRALLYAFMGCAVGLGVAFALSYLLLDRRYRPGKPMLDDLGLLVV